MSNTHKIPFAECVEVPWMVSTSISNIHLSAVENDGCRLLVDTFWGHHCSERQFRRVAVDFCSVAAVYFGLFRGDNECGGREPIDWPKVHAMKPSNEAELDVWLRAKAVSWEASGISPDAHFYRIVGSKWIDEYFGDSQHFMLCGPDAFVEVLARGYEWSEVEPLKL